MHVRFALRDLVRVRNLENLGIHDPTADPRRLPCFFFFFFVSNRFFSRFTRSEILSPVFRARNANFGRFGVLTFPGRDSLCAVVSTKHFSVPTSFQLVLANRSSSRRFLFFFFIRHRRIQNEYNESIVNNSRDLHHEKTLRGTVHR